VIEPADAPDAGAFLARLLRLDPAAVVRLRPAGEGAVRAWARLPFGVLVTRRLRADVGADVTVRASELLGAVEAGGHLPTPVDHEWRWPLPAGPGDVIEELAADDVRRVAAAAAATAREALAEPVQGRVLGSRRVRDALLDHVAIVVEAGGQRVEIPQRLVQGLARMGFIGEQRVSVRRAGTWIALSANYGSAWYRPPVGETLTLQVTPTRPTADGLSSDHSEG
jgi:hypothetical protein